MPTPETARLDDVRLAPQRRSINGTKEIPVKTISGPTKVMSPTGKVHIAVPSTDYPWPVTLCGQFAHPKVWPTTNPGYTPSPQFMCRTCARIEAKQAR